MAKRTSKLNSAPAGGKRSNTATEGKRRREWLLLNRAPHLRSWRKLVEVRSPGREAECTVGSGTGEQR